jgi:hypothetical protein
LLSNRSRNNGRLKLEFLNSNKLLVLRQDSKECGHVSMAREGISGYRILVGKAPGKCALGRPRGQHQDGY